MERPRDRRVARGGRGTMRATGVPAPGEGGVARRMFKGANRGASYDAPLRVAGAVTVLVMPPAPPVAPPAPPPPPAGGRTVS
jgi:hypothetical protein